jgi:hypothetical protein
LLPSSRSLSAEFSSEHPTRPMKGAKACRDPRGGEQRRSRATGTRRRTARSGTWPSRCDSASTSSPLRLRSFVKTTPRRAKLLPLELLRAPKVLWGGVSPLRPRPSARRTASRTRTNRSTLVARCPATPASKTDYPRKAQPSREGPTNVRLTSISRWEKVAEQIGCLGAPGWAAPKFGSRARLPALGQGGAGSRVYAADVGAPAP